MQPEQTEQAPIRFDRFSIFLIAKNAQNSYGIKQGDYMRYRRYCTRKVDKLRKIMDYKYGNRTKFIKKDITLDKANDKKILQVSLCMCQKYWAYAHQCKFNQSIKQSNKLRAKFMAVKKFKKAVQWSQKLSKICKQKTDHVTASQAQAYCFYLQGLLQLEQKNWKVAQTSLIACRQIISDLLASIDTMNAKVYRQKIDQVDQTIKFCNFKISKGQQISIEQIIQMRKNGEESLSNLIGNLAERKLKQISLTSVNQIKFGAQRYPIKDQKIIQMKSKIDVMLQNLQIVKKKILAEISDSQLFQQLLNFYSSTIITVDMTIKMADAHKDNVKQYTQGQIAIYKKISYLFQQIKLNIMIDRNNMIFKHSYSSSQSQSKKSAPQNLAKLLSNTITIYTQYVQLQKQKSEGSQGVDDLQKIRLVDAKIFYNRTLRLFFVGQVYYNNDKIKQAFSLWNQCQRCLQSVKNSQQQSIKAQLNLVALDEVSRKLKQNKLKCIIKNYKTNELGKDKLNNEMQEMNLQDNGQIKEKSNLTLYDYMIGSAGLNQLKLADYAQLKPIQLPGRMQPIPTRPIFFDIFQSTIQYPTLEDKVQKGWFGKLFKR